MGVSHELIVCFILFSANSLYICLLSDCQHDRSPDDGLQSKETYMSLSFICNLSFKEVL